MNNRIISVGIKDKIASAIQQKLAVDKFEFTSFSTTKEAFNYLKKSLPVLVLLSNDLSDIEDYREFCIALRSQPETVSLPIILYSEREEKESCKIETLKSSLLNDYIKPPVSIDEIIARLNIFIEMRLLQEELEHKNELLNKLSLTDELTGLYNRRFLLKRLTEELDRIKRYKGIVSCLMTDIDYFKKINDKFGHLVGDEVLIKISKLQKENIRNVDIIGRYGGEEFLVILPYTDLQQAIVVAEKLRKSVETFYFSDEKVIRLTLSIGVASCSFSDNADIDKFIKIADDQLYRAKKAGRNKVCAAGYKGKPVECFKKNPKPRAKK